MLPCALLPALLVPPPAVLAPDEAAVRLGAALERLRQEGELPALSAALVLGGDGAAGTLVVACAGPADPATGEPLTPDHFLPAGSIGKTLLGALALDLERDGRLSLDRPAAAWLAGQAWFEALPGHERFTLRQLLRHESGLAEYYTRPAFHEALRAAGADTRWSPEELCAFVADAPALFEPGEGWSYADTNFLVAGRAVERAADGEFFALVRERLLEPHGLAEGIVPTRRDLPLLAVGFTGARGVFPFPERMVEDGAMVIDPAFEWTGGGFATRPRDLARWMFLLHGGALLGPELTAELVADPVAAATGPGHRYALATQLLPTDQGELLGHSGWFPGWVSIAGYLPERRVAIAVQVTTDRTGRLGPDPLRRIAQEVVAAVLGE